MSIYFNNFIEILIPKVGGTQKSSCSLQGLQCFNSASSSVNSMLEFLHYCEGLASSYDSHPA